MSQKASGYAGRWKRWLTIYLGVAVVAYVAVYLLFFHHGGGAGGFHY
jgi:hypothetical protein